MTSTSRLIGNYFVKPTKMAKKRAWELCDGKIREFQKLKRLCVKLRWWPESVGRHGDERGEYGADLDWDWIKGLGDLRVGELRIDEPINSHENIRVIFFKSDIVRSGDPLPIIWLLHVFPKKRQGFTRHELDIFRAKRALIVSREYQGSPNA